jgi:hypothetical protein
MQAFCERHRIQQCLEDWSLLPPSSQAFLEKLDLPRLHPFCNATSDALLFPAAPDMGPAVEAVDKNLIEYFTTAWYRLVPPATSIFLIWLFFFSAYFAPLGLVLCLSFGNEGHLLDQVPLLPIATLVSSWIIMTDDQYVMEFGRLYGMTLVVATLSALRPRKRHCMLLVSVLVLCCLVSPWSLEDPVTSQIKPGLYFNANNPIIGNLISLWTEKDLPNYPEVATPWQLTGDARTGLPYVMNSVDRRPDFHRVWLATEDNEYVALDIAFPERGHDWQKPLYLVLHGLNGGSNEGYVVDFAYGRLKEGSTVVVMIARGLADTPIQGWTVRIEYCACCVSFVVQGELAYTPLLSSCVVFSRSSSNRRAFSCHRPQG